MNEDRFFGTILWTLLMAVVGAFAFAGYAAVRSALASGETAYCYVELRAPEGMPPVYQLFGFREWRADRHLGTFPTLDEAAKAAVALPCRMGNR